MAAIVALESVAIVLLSLLVAGLLKSHAEILRALNRLGVDLGYGSGGASGDLGHGQHFGVNASDGSATSVVKLRTGSESTSTPASDISGVTPFGEVVQVGVMQASRGTLMAFLSSGCSTCQIFWSQLDMAAKGELFANDIRLVVVTRSPEQESESSVRALSSDAVTVVMSSEAWTSYSVLGSPYFVYVPAGATSAAGEGVARNWEQVAALLSRARADIAASGLADASAGPGSIGAVTSPAAREARADGELMRAGIYPGHESLYPTGPGAQSARTSHETQVFEEPN